MKISDMTNDQAAEAMIRLSGPFSNICDDEEALEIIDEAKKIGEDGIPFIKAFPKLLPKFVAFALKKHKEDLYEIIGALNEVPTKKIGGMNFIQTVNMVRGSYDDVLASFFGQSGAATESKEKESA